MRTRSRILLVATLSAAVATPVLSQVYKYFTPGTVWTITMIRIVRTS